MKRVTQEITLLNYFKIWQAVSEEKNFEKFLLVQTVKASPHGGHVFWRIKISPMTFEKGHTRNNLVKLFKILTYGFGEEDIFRNFFMSTCSAKSLPPPMVAMINGSKFRKQFLKGSCKELFCEIISKSDQGCQRRRFFLRISLCQYSAKKSPPPTVAMFFNGSQFREQHLKRVTQGTILWNYFKIWQAVSEKNFEEFLWNPHSEKKASSPWRSCFLTDQNFANNFWKGHPRNNPI